MNEDKPSENKDNATNWYEFWKINDQEIEKQVRDYNSLKFKSARTGAALLFLLSAVATFGLSLIRNDVLSSVLDVATMLILALFIFKGKRWAIIAAMIYWTLAKIFALINAPMSALTILIWWALYMGALVKAYKVEVYKNKSSQPSN